MFIKLKKILRLFFDASTKRNLHKVVLNKITTIEFEANMLKLLQQITTGKSVIKKAKYILLLQMLQHAFYSPKFMLMLRELLVL
jgi:hypothetical protein